MNKTPSDGAKLAKEIAQFVGARQGGERGCFVDLHANAFHQAVGVMSPRLGVARRTSAPRSRVMRPIEREGQLK